MNAPTPEPNRELEEAADKAEEKVDHLLLLLQRKAAKLLSLDEEPTNPDTWESGVPEREDD